MKERRDHCQDNKVIEMAERCCMTEMNGPDTLAIPLMVENDASVQEFDGDGDNNDDHGYDDS